MHVSRTGCAGLKLLKEPARPNESRYMRSWELAAVAGGRGPPKAADPPQRRTLDAHTRAQRPRDAPTYDDG